MGSDRCGLSCSDWLSLSGSLDCVPVCVPLRVPQQRERVEPAAAAGSERRALRPSAAPAGSGTEALSPGCSGSFTAAAAG